MDHGLIVLDASAAIDIATSNLVESVDEVLGEDVVVPPAFYVETAAYALRAGRARPDVAGALRDLMWDLVTDVEALDRRLATAAWDLSGSLSFPDATYAAVAAHHDAALWTTDSRIARSTSRLPCAVRLLRRG